MSTSLDLRASFMVAEGTCRLCSRLNGVLVPRAEGDPSHRKIREVTPRSFMQGRQEF